jgi:uncharacterized protein (TIGR00369 family)
MAADEDEAVPAPPEGYAIERLRGPFSEHNGPYFERRTETGSHQAFFVLARHCNSAGYAHGGMLSAFMDGLLATAVGRASGAAGVTIHLSIDFLSPARRGHWVFGEATVSRVTQEVAFAEARLHAGGHDLVRGSGVFKLHRRKGG